MTNQRTEFVSEEMLEEKCEKGSVVNLYIGSDIIA